MFLETTQKPLFKHGFDEQGFETFFKVHYIKNTIVLLILARYRDRTRLRYKSLESSLSHACRTLFTVSLV